MTTFTARIDALVIERAELYAAYEFPELRSTEAERAARQARNEARAARIAETYAEVQQIIIEQLGDNSNGKPE